jgi:hypothetical protein
MRQSWTDDRLDDLSRHMDERFDRLDNDIHELRAEFGALQRTIIQVGGAIGGAMIVAMLGLIATQL